MTSHAPTASPTRISRPHRGLAAVLVSIGMAATGCDPSTHGKDAAPTTSHRLAQVSVRVDYPLGNRPAVSVLAFRAEATDLGSSDVLGVVDPLVAPSPDSSCELRDVAGAARALRAQGGTVNLQELDGVTLEGDGGEVLRPQLRVYPPLADVVGGVIGEAGPLDLGRVPESFKLAVPSGSEQPARLELSVPAAPTIVDGNDTPLDAHAGMSMKGDLVLRVVGPSRTFLEIRPFGAPSAIACAVTTGGWVVVPHDLLVKLVATAGRAPASFEAVWRESRLLSTGSETMRVSFETRSSAVVDLRP